MTSVLISIVTYQSAATIAACLRSVAEQTLNGCRVVVADNASSDGTADLVRRSGIEPVVNPHNVGFCEAHNRTIAGDRSDFVLVLNPDTELAPDFVHQLVGAMHSREAVGSACGKLLRLQQGTRSRVIDSAGMILLGNQRHLDRGAEETDRGQFDTPGMVFGATGAAVLYRRAFIEDVMQEEKFFDPHFFAYREDADVSWRGQWLGWQCLYWPRAVAWHVRRVTPQRRRDLPAEINYHSVKNRFLMRIKNLDTGSYLRHAVTITLRDLQILGYVLLLERSSLPAFSFVRKHFADYLRLRGDLRRRRRATARSVGAWLRKEIDPVCED